MSDNGTIKIENAKLIFRNFSGKENKYNAPGRRNFCVLIDNDIAEDLIDDGWNVKYLRPRDEGEPPQAYIQVKVSFEAYPPKIWLIASGKKTQLDEDTISALDYAEIENVDLIIRPYNWSAGGKEGITAYVKTMYVTIAVDEFEKKYHDLDFDDDSHTPF